MQTRSSKKKPILFANKDIYDDCSTDEALTVPDPNPKPVKSSKVPLDKAVVSKPPVTKKKPFKASKATVDPDFVTDSKKSVLISKKIVDPPLISDSLAQCSKSLIPPASQKSNSTKKSKSPKYRSQLDLHAFLAGGHKANFEKYIIPKPQKSIDNNSKIPIKSSQTFYNLIDNEEVGILETLCPDNLGQSPILVPRRDKIKPLLIPRIRLFPPDKPHQFDLMASGGSGEDNVERMDLDPKDKPVQEGHILATVEGARTDGSAEPIPIEANKLAEVDSGIASMTSPMNDAAASGQDGLGQNAGHSGGQQQVQQGHQVQQGQQAQRLRAPVQNVTYYAPYRIEEAGYNVETPQEKKDRLDRKRSAEGIAVGNQYKHLAKQQVDTKNVALITNAEARKANAKWIKMVGHGLDINATPEDRIRCFKSVMRRLNMSERLLNTPDSCIFSSFGNPEIYGVGKKDSTGNPLVPPRNSAIFIQCPTEEMPRHAFGNLRLLKSNVQTEMGWQKFAIKRVLTMQEQQQTKYTSALKRIVDNMLSIGNRPANLRDCKYTKTFGYADEHLIFVFQNPAGGYDIQTKVFYNKMHKHDLTRDIILDPTLKMLEQPLDASVVPDFVSFLNTDFKAEAAKAGVMMEPIEEPVNVMVPQFIPPSMAKKIPNVQLISTNSNMRAPRTIRPNANFQQFQPRANFDQGRAPPYRFNPPAPIPQNFVPPQNSLSNDNELADLRRRLAIFEAEKANASNNRFSMNALQSAPPMTAPNQNFNQQNSDASLAQSSNQFFQPTQMQFNQQQNQQGMGNNNQGGMQQYNTNMQQNQQQFQGGY